MVPVHSQRCEETRCAARRAAPPGDARDAALQPDVELHLPVLKAAAVRPHDGRLRERAAAQQQRLARVRVAGRVELMHVVFVSVQRAEGLGGEELEETLLVVN